MKKKHLILMATAILATISMNLQAQDSPNGNGTGTLNPIIHENCWQMNGNLTQ